MATLSPPIPSLSPPPPFPPFTTIDLGVPAALLLEGALAAGRRLAGHTAARIGLGAPFVAGKLGAAQARRLLGVLRIEGEARFRKLTERLVAADINLRTWADAFRGGIARLVAAGFHAIARGVPLSEAMKEAFRRAAGRQGDFFEKFRAAVASGRQLLDGTAVARAALYAKAIWGAAVNGERATRGHVEEFRALGITDHCDECVYEHNRGWQPAGTLREIGDTVCKAACACYFLYRDAPEPPPPRIPTFATAPAPRPAF